MLRPVSYRASRSFSFRSPPQPPSWPLSLSLSLSLSLLLLSLFYSCSCVPLALSLLICNSFHLAVISLSFDTSLPTDASSAYSFLLSPPLSLSLPFFFFTLSALFYSLFWNLVPSSFLSFFTRNGNVYKSKRVHSHFFMFYSCVSLTFLRYSYLDCLASLFYRFLLRVLRFWSFFFPDSSLCCASPCCYLSIFYLLLLLFLPFKQTRILVTHIVLRTERRSKVRFVPAIHPITFYHPYHFYAIFIYVHCYFLSSLLAFFDMRLLK